MKSIVPILVFCLLTLFGYSEIFASPLDSAKGTKKGEPITPQLIIKALNESLHKNTGQFLPLNENLYLINNREKLRLNSTEIKETVKLLERLDIGRTCFDLTNRIARYNKPVFPLDDREGSCAPAYLEIHQIGQILNTNLIPLIPFLFLQFKPNKAYPSAMYLLIHPRQNGIASLIKTQQSDAAPIRELGLCSLAAAAQSVYLESLPPQEISNQVLPLFKQYLAHPSTNRLDKSNSDYFHFGIYLDTVRCMAIDGLFFYSQTPEDCREILIRETKESTNPVHRFHALTRLWLLQERFETPDSITHKTFQEIAANPKEEIFIRNLAQQASLCPARQFFLETDMEHLLPDEYYIYSKAADMTKNLLISLPSFQSPLLPIAGTQSPLVNMDLPEEVLQQLLEEENAASEK